MKIQDLKMKFTEIFGEGDEPCIYFAPGRVNLIGDHTDYNGGHVFPCALTLGTYALARRRSDRLLKLYSENFSSRGVFNSSLDDIEYLTEAEWTNYPKGLFGLFVKRVIL